MCPLKLPQLLLLKTLIALLYNCQATVTAISVIEEGIVQVKQNCLYPRAHALSPLAFQHPHLITSCLSKPRRRNFLLATNLSTRKPYIHKKCIQTNRRRKVAHMKRIFFFLAALLLGRAFVIRMRELRAAQYD